jgi:hypothetical protein
MYVNHKMNKKQGQQGTWWGGGDIMHVCSYIYTFLQGREAVCCSQYVGVQLFEQALKQRHGSTQEDS